MTASAMRRPLRLIPLLAVLACGACSVTTTRGAPGREVVAPPGASTIAPYSPAIRSGGFLFLSGQVGLRPGTRELVGGGIAAETRQSLENVRTILAAAGLSLRDVVKCTVFLADMAEYEPMNAVYGEFFPAAPPARSAVAVAALPLAARVEIDCIAEAGR